MNELLWYRGWTTDYKEGLPVGNGRLAAMALGEPEALRIALNHEWLWKGVTRYRDYPDVSEHLPEVRAAINGGNFLKGTQLANDYLGGTGGVSGKPGRVDSFQPAGDVFVRFGSGNVTDYKRSLNIANGLVEVRFKLDGVNVRQRLFASSTDDCIIAEIATNAPADFKIELSRIEDADCDTAYAYAPNSITLSCGFKGGTSFADQVKVVSDGALTSDEKALSLTASTKTLLFIQIGTSANGNAPSDEFKYPEKTDFDALFDTHARRFSRLLGDAVLNVPTDDADDVPTDERIERFSRNDDATLPVLYFNYGKYLMVSGSSAELPLNLQGKWNEDLEPAWQSDYHLDINIQMNYWFVETLGMSETAIPLFNLIENNVPYAKTLAKRLYGCNGIVFGLNTDAWGRSTPEAYGYAVWIGAAPWLGQHLYQHYRHTKDERFLRERCYPYLKECAAFYEDYLIEYDGQLRIVPSQSPENRFEGTGDFPVSIGFNSAMDVELATELFISVIDCAVTLGVDKDKVARWEALLARLPKLGVDSIGRLNEWDSERAEVEPGHRHFSHLYGLYPSQLFKQGAKEWTAAERSLDYRLGHGGGHTGWSRAWTSCLMARLERADDAWEHLIRLIGDFATKSLLDLHPPKIFQIDGNMGGTACVCEMLMQSRRGELKLLPALPKLWRDGSITDFRGQDGICVSLDWKDGRLTKCTINASEPLTLNVIYANKSVTVVLKAGYNTLDVAVF